MTSDVRAFRCRAVCASPAGPPCSFARPKTNADQQRPGCTRGDSTASCSIVFCLKVVYRGLGRLCLLSACHTRGLHVSDLANLVATRMERHAGIWTGYLSTSNVEQREDRCGGWRVAVQGRWSSLKCPECPRSPSLLGVQGADCQDPRHWHHDEQIDVYLSTTLVPPSLVGRCTSGSSQHLWSISRRASFLSSVVECVFCPFFWPASVHFGLHSGLDRT